ncbi:MAG TPA: hypothetical protein VIG46_03630 [Candidatus Baltobacteraceae bacterium]|jgi:hypothetical protein
MRYARITITTALALVLTVASAFAQSAPTLYSGSQINAIMDDQLDSGTTQVGDTFSMHVVAPYPSNDDSYAGAQITGHVVKVVAAGRGTNPELQLGIDRLILRDGTSVQLPAQVTSAGTKQQSKNGAQVALSTIGGMILGNVIGKAVLHTNGGGIVGAAGGFLYGLNKKANVTLPAQAAVQLTLTRDVTVRRQAHT